MPSRYALRVLQGQLKHTNQLLREAQPWHHYDSRIRKQHPLVWLNTALAEPSFNDHGAFAAFGLAFLFVVLLSLLLLAASTALGGLVVKRWNKKRGTTVGRGWGWALGFVGGLALLVLGIQPLVLLGGFLGIMVQQVFFG